MEKIKRILILEPSLSYHPLSRFSAVASVLYSMAELFDNNGYEVWMNEYSFDKLKENEYSDPAMKSLPSGSFLRKNAPAKLKSIYHDYRIVNHQKNLKNKLKKNPKPDLLLSFVNYSARLGVDLAKHWKIPLFSVFDGPIADEYKYLQGGYPTFKKRIDNAEIYNVKHSDYCMTYSTAMKEYLENKVNTKIEAVIHQLVDFKRLRFVEEKTYNKEIRIAYIGSFLKWHNVDMLLRAFTRLRQEGFRSKLSLLGTGQEIEKIKTIVERSPYKADIKFTGFIDGERLKKELAIVDIGVISGALWYHAPVKFFQYAAAKLAVVAPLTPTITEFSEQYKAFSLFEDNSEEGLYLALKKLMQHPETIPEKALDGQNFIKAKYNKQKNMELYQRIFDHLEKPKLQTQ